VGVRGLDYLGAAHSRDGTSTTPLEPRVLSLVFPAEVVVSPGVGIGFFDDLDTVVVGRDTAIRPLKVNRPDWVVGISGAKGGGVRPSDQEKEREDHRMKWSEKLGVFFI